MVRPTVVTGALARHAGLGRRMMVAMKLPSAEPRRYLPGSPFKPPAPPPPAETFAVHDQVTHDKYGLGVILGVEDDIAVLVDFGPQRLRIPVPCAKLTKL
jgi:hypothetical protein